MQEQVLSGLVHLSHTHHPVGARNDCKLADFRDVEPKWYNNRDGLMFQQAVARSLPHSHFRVEGDGTTTGAADDIRKRVVRICGRAPNQSKRYCGGQP